MFLRDIRLYFEKIGELLFFPSFCEICGKLLDSPGESVVCGVCFDSLRSGPRSYCIRCGQFFSGYGGPRLCQNCNKKDPSFGCHRSCASYSGKMKDIILLFKYREYRILGSRLADFILTTLGKDVMLWKDLDMIVPVPLHKKRQTQRGFNQAQVLAKALERRTGIRSIPKLLVKVRNVPPQTSLEGKARRKNIRGAFGIKKEKKVKDKTILLVDDVYTTGSTVEECARILKKAGAREVKVLTLAQA